MASWGAFLLLSLMFLTALVLIIGIGLMARGGEANRKYGNKMMVARVAFQGLALAVLAILLMMRHSHS
jgi:hypothetical protein